MSFWDDVVDTLGAYNPVTLGAYVGGEIVNKIIPGNGFSKGVEAPYNYFKSRQSPSIGGITKAASSAVQAAGGVAGGPLGTIAGFDSSGLSDVSGLLHSTGESAPARINPDRSTISNEAGAAPTPFRVPQSDSFLVPAAIAGGALIVGLLLFGRK